MGSFDKIGDHDMCAKCNRPERSCSCATKGVDSNKKMDFINLKFTEEFVEGDGLDYNYTYYYFSYLDHKIRLTTKDSSISESQLSQLIGVPITRTIRRKLWLENKEVFHRISFHPELAEIAMDIDEEELSRLHNLRTTIIKQINEWEKMYYDIYGINKSFSKYH